MRPAIRLFRGFSLVELLAVIAIIGVLAALTIFAVSRVRTSARTAQCSSNQRQVALAILLAAQDNRGAYPPSHDKDNPNVAWPVMLEDYFGGPKSGLLICPARAFEPPQANYHGACYSLNPRIVATLFDATPRQVRITDVPRPAEVILVADGGLRPNGGAHGVFWQVETAGLSNPWPGGADRVIDDGPDVDDGTACFRFRHDGRLNVAFADGRVGSFEKGTIRQRNLHIAY